MNNIIEYMSNKGKLVLASAFIAGSGMTALAAVTGNTLKGKVVDPEGNPIPGAVVNLAEQSKIVFTDENGEFSIKDANYDDEVNAKCVGYLASVMPVEDFSSPITIVLQPDSDPYSHEAPVAFNEQKKKFLTDSRSVVTGEELQRYPVTVLQNAFNSVLPGVSTYEWSSEPGWTETQMYVRGIRTMNTSARNPLVIVDNVERDLSFLDAFPIETITVLKDAAATALYGMRGANGVILVTTKRGESGKTRIDFTQEVGFQTLSNKMESQDSYNMALTRNQVRYLSGQEPMYSADVIEKYRRVCNGETLEGMDRYRYFNTNWFDQLYRETAPVLKTNLQISGGNNRARYYVSFSYLRQEGMWNSDWTNMMDRYTMQHVLNRWNLRSNLDINVNKYLRVGLDLGGRIDNINQPTTGVFNLTTFGAVEANPMEPVYTPDGHIYSSTTAQNPARLLGSAGQEKNRRRNLYSTAEVTGLLDPITKGLEANLVVSFDAFDVFQSSQYNSINTYSYDYMNMDVTKPEDFTLTQTTTYSELTNPTANERANSWTLNFLFGFKYNRDFGKHHIDANAFIRTYQQRLNVREANTDNSQYSSDRFLSWNGQATYVFDNRYIVSGNISRMGNDNFAPDDRWGTFWGASLGWVASQESFLRNPNIDLLKLRASYGKAGMSDTGAGRYPYQSIFASNNGYGFGHNATWVPGIIESIAGNPNSKWEISKMVNIGLDWDFWHRRLYGSFDIFKEWRSNILVERSTIPDIIGITYAKDSYGKVESKGLELVIGHANRIGRVNYSIEGQLSWNRNKITEMDETEPLVEWQRKTGRPIFEQTSVQQLYEGAFNGTVGGWNQYQFVQWASDPDLIATSQADAIANPHKYPYNSASAGNQPLGTAVFKDLNGDRMIDERDMAPIGYTIMPELTPSVAVNVGYAGFDVRAVLTAYLNRSVFVSPTASFSGWSNMGTHEVVNAWGYYTDDPTDPRNINAKYPRPVYGGFNNIDSNRDTRTYQNDIWIMNGDYLSLRNIEIGYSLPEKLISKIHMSKCRFYFSGYNLFNWSHLPKGMDPEKPMSYCWWYPKTRIFNFGVNVTF